MQVITWVLGDVAVDLQTGSGHIANHWQHAGLQHQAPPAPGETTTRPRPADIVIRLEEAARLPGEPAQTPLYAGRAPGFPVEVSGLAVYDRGPTRELFFNAGAWAAIHNPDSERGAPWRVEGRLKPAVLARGRLDDVFFTALAAPLRRFGVYLAHGFGLTSRGRAVLLLGPTGSGKTTAGLALLADGWEFLGNDVVALRATGPEVWALPTPSMVGIRDREAVGAAEGEYRLATGAVRSWGAAAPVAAMLFLQPQGPEPTRPEGVGRAVALARLMENSLDRWDEAAAGEHTGLLERLAGQAEAFVLAPGAVRRYAVESLAATWK